jgi:hypothetical protein
MRSVKSDVNDMIVYIRRITNAFPVRKIWIKSNRPLKVLQYAVSGSPVPNLDFTYNNLISQSGHIEPCRDI